MSSLGNTVIVVAVVIILVKVGQVIEYELLVLVHGRYACPSFWWMRIGGDVVILRVVRCLIKFKSQLEEKLTDGQQGA